MLFALQEAFGSILSPRLVSELQNGILTITIAKIDCHLAVVVTISLVIELR